ncbi:DUF5689 domain-containing protein [Lutibacter sp.]|uniref:DUF5689 domain-containing protein n=1 Tax=Lutibacter sp. TaxID=1925666 RepID=UPI001A329CD2|nr:DUF5689 domain-containing protein [Lutibacter sp.]MBI9040953.1 lamin tail domain-containing protein [Lutibacter sp.]
MKNNKTIKFTTSLVLLISVFAGCVKDQDFSTPNVDCDEPLLQVTNTISQVKDMYTFGGATVIENDVIIEGYVVSSDKSGNIYKSISIQDKPENPTSAIKISIDETNLYAKYEVGRKIYVKLKGLAVGYSFGSVQIGKAVAGELGRISSYEINNYIIRSCEVAAIVPKKVIINELNESMLEMLVEIENIQFKTVDIGQAYGNVGNTATVNRVLESFDNNCNLVDEVIVRNSGYSKFKDELLPEGKGSVVAIFSNYYEDYQLYLRDTDDVQLTQPRCDYSNVLTPTKTISEIKAMYTGAMIEFGVSTDYIVEGYVVSSDLNGSFEKKLVIQDKVENPTAGITILMDNDAIFEQFEIGDKVFVKLNKLYMTKVDGVLTVGYPNGTKIAAIETEAIGSFIYNSGENKAILPTEINISDILNEQYQNTLVKVTDVQLVQNELGKAFAFFTGDNDGSRTLETCGESFKLIVFTNGNANFANQLFPKGHGSIVGVLGENIEIRSVDDVQFEAAYEVCEVIIPKIMITEVADPINNVSARFVELFNAGDSEINLSGWKLNKYVNGSVNVSSGAIDLNGITISAGGFVIIANSDYKTVFNDIPEIESTYISGNGDDVYELVDNSGATIDIYGVIGEDGNGTNWEYLDGRAVRNLDIIEPNSVFEISEWTVYSDAANNLISYPNSPKIAPNDFSPNLR